MERHSVCIVVASDCRAWRGMRHEMREALLYFGVKVKVVDDGEGEQRRAFLYFRREVGSREPCDVEENTWR
jgi:hypothetical protein